MSHVDCFSMINLIFFNEINLENSSKIILHHQKQRMNPHCNKMNLPDSKIIQFSKDIFQKKEERSDKLMSFGGEGPWKKETVNS